MTSSTILQPASALQQHVQVLLSALDVHLRERKPELESFTGRATLRRAHSD